MDLGFYEKEPNMGRFPSFPNLCFPFSSHHRSILPFYSRPDGPSVTRADLTGRCNGSADTTGSCRAALTPNSNTNANTNINPIP